MRNFLENESGATAIEYGLIAALIAVALIGGAAALGADVAGLFDGVDSDIDTVF